MVISVMVYEKNEFENCHLKYSLSTLTANLERFIRFMVAKLEHISCIYTGKFGDVSKS